MPVQWPGQVQRPERFGPMPDLAIHVEARRTPGTQRGIQGGTVDDPAIGRLHRRIKAAHPYLIAPQDVVQRPKDRTEKRPAALRERLERHRLERIEQLLVLPRIIACHGPAIVWRNHRRRVPTWGLSSRSDKSRPTFRRNPRPGRNRAPWISAHGPR